MRVRVYAPPFADFSSVDERGWVELAEGTTLDGLLRGLRIPLRGATVLLFTVNRERARLSRVLADGDTVSFLPLLAGG